MEGRQCTATSKQSGERCRRAPIKGGTVCKIHGGGSSRVQAAADRRLAEVEMQDAVKTLGLPVDIDPAKALLDEIAYTYGHVQWLRGKVQELGARELTWGVTQKDDGIGPQGPVDMTTEKSGPNVWYQMYLTEREHLVKVTSAALRAGIE